MPVVHWNPWTELERVEHRLHRVFDLPFPRLFPHGPHTPWQPPTDISETGTAYVLEADLPGMTLQDLSVRLDGTTVVIAGQRQRPHAGRTHQHGRMERSCGPFQRAFTLPAAVRQADVQATYAHGVLTITIPKVDAAWPRQIPVQAA